jgi:hypothetical protein
LRDLGWAASTLRRVLPAGATTTVTLVGHDLRPDIQVLPHGPGVTVQSVTWVSDEELTVQFAVAPSAAAGARSLVLLLPAGAAPGSTVIGSCVACLTVAPIG